MGQEVKIKIRAFPYYEDVEDPISGETRPVERIARRGDVVELDDKNLARAKKFDAIADPEDDVEPEGGDTAQFPESVTIEDASVEQVADWIKREKPTVDAVVEEANENPENARKLIEAEELATGQQPRSTLVEKLEEIANG